MFLNVMLLLLLELVTALSIDCQVSSSFISALNIGEYQDCNTVEGSLVINQTSLTLSDPGISPLSEDQLSILLSITEITGYLHIHDLNTTNITNLRFLRNLEKINGQETLNPRPNQHFALVIEDNNFLETLGLASLELIENGGVKIGGNPKLCLVDTVEFDDYLSSGAQVRVGGLSTDCTVNCHGECSLSRGCWGVLPDECEECANYVYQGTCISSCDPAISYVENSTKECLPLSVPTTEPATTPTPHSSHPLSTPPTQTDSQTTEQRSTEQPTTVTTSPSTGTTEKPSTNWVVIIAPSSAPILLLLLVILVAACVSRKVYKKMVAKKNTGIIGEGLSQDDYTPMISLKETSPRKRSTSSKRFENSRPYQNTAKEDDKSKFAPQSIEPTDYTRPDPWGYVKIEHLATTKNSLSAKTSADRQSVNSTDLSESPPLIHKINLPQPAVPGGVYSTRLTTSQRLTAHRGSLTSNGGLSSRSSSMPSRSSLLMGRARTSALNSDYSLTDRQGNFNE